MAMVILVGAVSAVSWAMAAGHQHTQEAQLRITASLALEHALAIASAYSHNDLEDLAGVVGAYAADPPDNPYPVNRQIQVLVPLPPLPGPNGVTISTTNVTITILDLNDRVLLTHTAVFTEPSAVP